MGGVTVHGTGPLEEVVVVIQTKDMGHVVIVGTNGDQVAVDAALAIAHKVREGSPVGALSLVIDVVHHEVRQAKTVDLRWED